MPYRKHYPSEHKDDSIAFWLEAFIHQLDTHVLWSAKVCTRSDKGKEVVTRWFFEDYFCDAEVLHEFIKRGLVVSVKKEVKKHIIEGAWEELQKVIDYCNPYISIPLNDETERHNQKYREPKENLWFEVVVDSFSEEMVKFSFSLFGYKYILSDLELVKQEFYEFEDRLGGKIRFVNDWLPLDEMIRKLSHFSEGDVLRCIEPDLRHELNLLKKPTKFQITSSCKSIFPLLERVLRNHSEKQGWKGKSGNIDVLTNKFEQNEALSQDTIEILRFVARPMRDYIQHGREMGVPVAKVVLVTTLESLVRLRNELELQ